jgi:hypothetical protein
LRTLAFSQSSTTAVGNWLMFFNQTRLSEKWSINSEVQYRSFEIAPNTEQLLLRAGINYHTSNSSFICLGYANVTNYDFDKEQLPGVQVNEHRLWQQFIMRHNIGRCFFEHRYRFEQRWLESSSWSSYLNRVRYLFRISVPLNKKIIEKNTIFLSFYDEVFVHFTSMPFDRNRLYGALCFQFNTSANVQIGYLAQTLSSYTKQYLQVGLFYNIDLRKKD